MKGRDESCTVAVTARRRKLLILMMCMSSRDATRRCRAMITIAMCIGEEEESISYRQQMLEICFHVVMKVHLNSYIEYMTRN